MREIDCVSVGLDWAEPMMQFVLHVTCSCIFHAYVLYFSIYLLYLNCFGVFLIVSFFPLSILFTLVVSMAPKRKSTPSQNPLRWGIHFVWSYSFIYSVPWWECLKGILGELFSMRHSFWMPSHPGGLCRHRYPMSFTVEVRSHCVTSQSHVHLCWYRSSTLTCMDSIIQYLILSLAFEVSALLSHRKLLRMCSMSLG